MFMRTVGNVVVVAFAFAIVGCGSKVDLSTKEATLRTFHKAAIDGDKETVKKCLSKRILETRGDRFDEDFQEMQALANKMSVEDLIEKYNPRTVQEGGDWKIDEIPSAPGRQHR